MSTVSYWDEPPTAIVTGGASGIGVAIAQRLSIEGAAVAIFDLDQTGATTAADKLVAAGGRAIAAHVDVTDRSRIDAAIDETARQLGPPTILVNSAGLDGFEKFQAITAQSWQQILAVNLTGVFDCCQAIVPHMLDAGWGRIVNISSSSAQTGNPLMVHYSAAKAGVVGFTKALAQELGPRGITVNTIPPGFIDTPMLRRSEDRGFLGPGVDAAEAKTPVRRIGQPDDVAAACAFLCSQDAGYITGQVLGVNGGRVL
ncbi:SDR family oxidoreductase [Mycolicibacterium fortuitum]|uniref:3-oxoacyl-[acyl-carrier-protein] reductase MabA n=1 Tax=Mycolicibacterium fortuitum subsp. fortuitum DSM 46621 = ATCC 6841 = JCM 6387 TaxID=1214102 RepID=K0UXG7_MYCFO|nr:SDR family NAD(P)-dependent oxidoreductase [Mycolicibacterium fortuitum]AIY46715.1 3-oxoacyl-[acyl-carrier protein] reductase [Mycobacterium sp. VKM Ac-1817D]CRL79539.1 3-oxoacyl-(acyl-carrier-protein) reductase, putative [Mycolicibacter nonchromogenicus]EJZ09785.1 short-chain dehydrogenase/reductase SDR [Mycolicibacterium fortuitum subsp. fortuitum DSM 46621 = ATCC 6841 = JCM 6387]WEV30162.1 SDR family oxidoreductase [Mycolicibacterium fortuitum]CRL57603.1 3-oxoacyl-(acyl-carrier-protein) 